MLNCPTEAIETLGYLENVPSMLKKPRLANSAPSPAATSPGHMMNSVAKAAPRSVSAPAPKSKAPTEPVARLRFLLNECLDSDDDEEEAHKVAGKVWGIIADVTPEQTELIAVVVATILKIADDEILVYMGKILQFTMRLRKWVVAEHNKDKKSSLIPKMLKVS